LQKVYCAIIISMFTNPQLIMGLDSYLYGTKTFQVYHSQVDDEPLEQTMEFQTIIEETHFKDYPVDTTPWASYTVTYPLAYWCKASAIHNWFVQNVQRGKDDCGEYSVTSEELSRLGHLVRSALDRPDIAGTYLPNVQGCFFGDQDYSEWYFDKLKYTKSRIEAILSYQNDAIQDDNFRKFHKYGNVVQLPTRNNTFDNFIYTSSW
jgi:hypothetical protein